LVIPHLRTLHANVGTRGLFIFMIVLPSKRVQRFVELMLSLVHFAEYAFFAV
jgi:hypothetical protein